MICPGSKSLPVLLGEVVPPVERKTLMKACFVLCQDPAVSRCCWESSGRLWATTFGHCGYSLT